MLNFYRLNFLRYSASAPKDGRLQVLLNDRAKTWYHDCYVGVEGRLKEVLPPVRRRPIHYCVSQELHITMNILLQTRVFYCQMQYHWTFKTLEIPVHINRIHHKQHVATLTIIAVVKMAEQFYYITLINTASTNGAVWRNSVDNITVLIYFPMFRYTALERNCIGTIFTWNGKEHRQW